MTDIDQAELDEAHRLIGLFFVSVSTLVSHPEYGLHKCIGISDPLSNRVVSSVLHHVAAGQLCAQFCAATAMMRDVAADEQKIRNALSKRCVAVIGTRNLCAHADWTMITSRGVGTEAEPESITSVEPKLMSIAHPKTGIEERILDKSTATLRREADEALEVAGLVWEYIWGLFITNDDSPQVADRLGFDAGVLVGRDLTGWVPKRAE